MYSKIALLGSLLVFCTGLSAQPGSLDPTFGKAGITITNFYTDEDQAFGAVLRSDGRLLLVGNTTYDSLQAFGAVQLLPDGSLDRSFDLDGQVSAPMNYGKGDNVAYAVALYPDGKALLAGIARDGQGYYDFALLRLLPDGKPDNSFGNSGRIMTDFDGGDDFAYAVMLQPDEKIVVAGHTSAGGDESDFALARYLPDGSPDSTFGVDGRVLQSIDIFSDVIFDAALQPDGKIVVAGTIYDQIFESDYIVARYLPNGSLDSTFGKNGVVTVGFNAEFDLCRAVALQPDGKIVAAGISTVNFISEISAVRLLPEGTPDSTFGLNGKVLMPVGNLGSFCTDLLIQPDGKMLLSGMTEDVDARDFLVLRLQANGAPDSGFGDAGIRIVSVSDKDDNSYALALEPNGNILLAGRSDDFEKADMTVLRYGENGALDETYGAGGVSRTDIGTSGEEVHTLGILSNGQIVTGGYLYVEDAGSQHNFEYNEYFLHGYLSDGSTDTAFGKGGTALPDFSPAYDNIGEIAVQPDNKMVANCRISNVPGLIRYNPDGTPDASFGINGMVASTFGAGLSFASVALQSDGRIVTVASQGNQNLLLRFLPNGNPDPAFGSNGVVTGLYPGGSLHWGGARVDSKGRIVAFGYRYLPAGPYEYFVARFHSDGSPDQTFGTNGWVVLADVNFFTDGIEVITPQADGKILLGGQSNLKFGKIIRLLENGERDISFGVDGTVLLDDGNEWQYVSDLIVQPDGRLLLTTPVLKNGVLCFVVLRLDPGGVPDGTFGQGGRFQLDGIPGSAYAVRLQPDGNIVAAGTKNNGSNRSDILVVRLLTGPALGIADLPGHAPTLLVYPNPVVDKLTLEYELLKDQTVSIQFVAPDGRLLKTLMPAAQRFAGKHREALQLPAGLPAGMYTLVAETAAGKKALGIVIPDR